MKAVEFAEQNTIFAADQPEYQPLPALRLGDPEGTVISCWELSPEEIEHVQKTGKVWLSIWTFNRGYPPCAIVARKEEVIPEGMIERATPSRGCTADTSKVPTLDCEGNPLPKSNQP